MGVVDRGDLAGESEGAQLYLRKENLVWEGGLRCCRGFEGGGESERTVDSADVMHRDGPIFELRLLVFSIKLEHRLDAP